MKSKDGKCCKPVSPWSKESCGYSSTYAKEVICSNSFDLNEEEKAENNHSRGTPYDFNGLKNFACPFDKSVCGSNYMISPGSKAVNIMPKSNE